MPDVPLSALDERQQKLVENARKALERGNPDYVVTVCDHARESCPVFMGAAKVVHVGFDDPPALARTAASEAEALGHYRRVRDEIKAWVETLPESLTERSPAAGGSGAARR